MTEAEGPQAAGLDHEYADALALADEFVGTVPSSSNQSPPSHEVLWRVVDSDDVSENVRARILELVSRSGGMSDEVVKQAQLEVEKAIVTLRLRRTLLVADMFDPIRSDAQEMFETELAQLAAIVPELLEAHRAAAEQQQRIASSMAEMHRLQMEGARERAAIMNELALQQSKQHDDYMRSLRAQSDARHKAFIESMRGSRY